MRRVLILNGISQTQNNTFANLVTCVNPDFSVWKNCCRNYTSVSAALSTIHAPFVRLRNIKRIHNFHYNKLYIESTSAITLPLYLFLRQSEKVATARITNTLRKKKMVPYVKLSKLISISIGISIENKDKYQLCKHGFLGFPIIYENLNYIDL